MITMKPTALLVALTLASAAALAADGLSLNKPETATEKKCQNDSAEVQKNSLCGVGDMACLARVQNEMDLAVKTCIRAMDELKPLPVPATPAKW